MPPRWTCWPSSPRGRSAARLLLVATYRPVDAQLHGQALPALAERLAAQQRAQLISLPPLDAPQVQAWLDHRFGQAHFSGQLAPWLQRQSAGNPLLLGATVAALVDDGSVRRDGAQWQMARAVPDEALALPQPLAPLVAARLALLSALQREVLEAASVVGMQCSMQLLQAALQRPVPELEEACRALAERQLFLQPLPAASWPDGSTAAAFAFEHDLWRRAIYEGIALARRQVLHQRVAERLEAGWGTRASEVAGPLAVAYERANQPEACARVLEVAAGVCVARFAYREAIDNLQAALQQWARLDASPARAAVEARLQLGLANLRVVGRGDGAGPCGGALRGGRGRQRARRHAAPARARAAGPVHQPGLLRTRGRVAGRGRAAAGAGPARTAGAGLGGPHLPGHRGHRHGPAADGPPSTCNARCNCPASPACRR